jgi:type IV pilus assembly protein PilX
MRSAPEAKMNAPRSIQMTFRTKQNGAALAVGLLLLLVLTLLAISGMNTASLELIMAGNTQYRQNAFQAAETGIERALVDGGFNPSSGAQQIPATNPPQAIPGTNNADGYVVTITPALGGAPQPALWGSSWDSFSTYHFDIQSTGTSVRNAVVVNFQGVAVISPADSTVTPIGTDTVLQ